MVELAVEETAVALLLLRAEQALEAALSLGNLVAGAEG